MAMVDKMRVVSLDAGRKYFSLEQLKNVVDMLADNGYTHLHLLVGNDGLRLTLDDMRLDVAGTVYESEAVQEAIKVGNVAYYDDPNGNTLTEAEMDELLVYMGERDIELIPAVNTPGHMDAILETMKHLGIEAPNYIYHDPDSGESTVSKRTVDLKNDRAVAFTKALVELYATYFEGKVAFFNMGLDEYANDAIPNWMPGWKNLQKRGEYEDFVAYTNDLARLLKQHGLRPIAFNDGLYFDYVSDQGTFDSDIVIAYWTAGWEDYEVASSHYFSERGHDILNTNDSWYYVIGREDKESGWYNLEQGLDGMNKVPFNQVLKDEDEAIPTIGSMIAAWCDDPDVPYIEPHLKHWLETFSQKNNEQFSN